MLNFAINNEPIRDWHPEPALTTNPIFGGYRAMAESERIKSVKICKVEDCSKTAYCKGYCTKHYQRFKRYGSPLLPVRMKKICKVDGCTAVAKCNGYCVRHDVQMKRYGEIRGNPSISRRMPNKLRIIGDICYITLTDRWGETVAIAMVDAEDYEKVKGHKWYFTKTSVMEWKNKKGVKLHRLIMGNVKKYKEVDHINHDILDNRKQNLRVATHKENLRNQKIPKNNKSGYKGVYWVDRANRWVASIRNNAKTIHLGYFNSIHDAAKAYNEKASELWGEFAHLNAINRD